MTERVPSSSEALGDAQVKLARIYEDLGLVYAAAAYSQDQFTSGYAGFRSAVAEALDRVHAASGLIGT